MRTPSLRGVTLVELLVVIGVMLILATIAIPMMRSLTEARRIREPARAINVYFGRARSRAIESGRPCGVLFERLERQPQTSVVLHQVEVPPPYGGNRHVSAVLPVAFGGHLRLRVRPIDMAPRIVRRGDRVKLNYQGALYRIVDDRTDNSPVGAVSPPADPGRDFPLQNGFIDFTANGAATVDADGWIDSHWLTLGLNSIGTIAVPPFPAPVPFQIFGQPVASAGAPLELSRGAVVDLGASGTDLAPDGFAPNAPQDASPVIVVFGSDGAVDHVVVHGVWSQVIGPIYFLIGTWGHVPAAPVQAGVDSRGNPRVPNPDVDDGLYNWEDQRNLWVGLNSQTGLVTVAEMYAPSLDTSINTYLPAGDSKREQILDGRKFVRQAQVAKTGR